MPGTKPGASPAFYADLVRSRVIIEPTLENTYRFTRNGAERQSTLRELYDIRRGSEAVRREKARMRLRDDVTVTAARTTDIVRLSVAAPAPEVAQQAAARILDLVNLEARQSHAGAERRFVEGRMAGARSDLSAAETRLAAFRDRNAQFSRSPRLSLEHDRLEREVEWRQQVFTSLAQAYEEARIEEVRNIPVITVIDVPARPVRPDPRGTMRWGLLGIMAGLLVATALAFSLEFFRRGKVLEVEEYQEFARLRTETLRDLRRPWRLLLPNRPS